MWVIIQDGEVFEGTLGSFCDCFGFNPNEEGVKWFCNDNQYYYKILTDVDEIEARFKLFGWTLVKDISMKYKILTDSYKLRFEQIVNEALKDGWKVHGPTTIMYVNGSMEYFQAVTKEE